MKAFIDQRVLERFRSEYLEMPGMKLRVEQVQRLCGVDAATCAVALDALVKAGFLCLKPDATYVRLAEGPSPARRATRGTLKPRTLPTSRAS
jgi:hypothetical protein